MTWRVGETVRLHARGVCPMCGHKRPKSWTPRTVVISIDDAKIAEIVERKMSEKPSF